MRRILPQRLIAFLIGTIPGVVYSACDMVGTAGAVFLVITGGSVGVALTLHGVSTRRVIRNLAIASPIAWPVTVFVALPKETTSPPQFQIQGGGRRT